MTVNEAYLIYFSPTHTSKQIAEAIVQGAGIKNIFPINVTQQAAEEVVIPTSALAIVVVPVYGGHVAPLAMERLRNIRGLDAPTVWQKRPTPSKPFHKPDFHRPPPTP